MGPAKKRGTKLLAPKPTQSDEAQSDRGSGSEADTTQQDVKPPPRNAVSAERDIAPLPCPPRDTTAAPSSDHGAPPGDVTAPARDGSAPRWDGRSPRRDAIKHPDDDGTSAARGSGGNVPPVDAHRQVKKQESAIFEAPGAILGGRQAADGRKGTAGGDDGGREEAVRQRRRAEREAGAPKTLPPDAEVLEVNFLFYLLSCRFRWICCARCCTKHTTVEVDGKVPMCLAIENSSISSPSAGQSSFSAVIHIARIALPASYSRPCGWLLKWHPSPLCLFFCCVLWWCVVRWMTVVMKLVLIPTDEVPRGGWHRQL